MEAYLEKLKSVADLKEELLHIYHVDSQAKLAVALNMTEATLSRLLRATAKNGPEVENAKILVNAFAKHKGVDVNAIRKKIYGFLYPEDILKKKMAEGESYYDNMYGEYIVESNESQTLENQKLQEQNGLIEDTFEHESDEDDCILKSMRCAIEDISKQSDLNIEESVVSEKMERGVIYRVSESYMSVFSEVHLKTLFGIHVTEENYKATIHNIAELKTSDGIIILFCENEDVFDKAWRDEKLRVENNVMLYCLSEERRIFMKATRKGQKKFLKGLFKDQGVVFPCK